MNVIKTIKEMQQYVQETKLKDETVGFVPTMGYLHEGHLTLLHEAKRENDTVVLSIFVNPTQFGPNEDFDSYPRDFERDERLAKEAGVDVLFYPTVEEMYPNEPTIQLKVTKRVDVLCGAKRPGHFDGVATVLTKLFHIVTPNRAYFGMKDAQQVAVVDALIADFHFPVTLVPVGTIREEDGLAKSSRNVYLTEQERKEAPFIYKSLQKAKQRITEGETNPEKIKKEIEQDLRNHTNGRIDYVDIYSYPHLTQIDHLSGRIILAVAVAFSKARLIDNLTFEV
ncbi:pantoate--beta-alanine ligase [Metabacillus iocasae]|uniref:Pantothenate synthetase n=1 Tax=Priestia iocasae TaxID=2291674 RepID=A0ABS2QV26_9BACI|nr:pantoate--beta-alanine ligase [Metabacillus iocasae]MBM7703331.1 pantoate--beta-alanine ligase [Metabacillus iocasae]